MDNNKFTDLVLVADDGTEFPCHKYKLYSASEYFERLFTSDFKEASSTRIEIKKIPSNILLTILKYIYTNEYTFNLDELPNLLNGIEEFQLTKFKELIDCALCVNVELLSSVNQLHIFEMYSLHHVLKKIGNIILDWMQNSDNDDVYLPANMTEFDKLDDTDIPNSIKCYIRKFLIGCKFQDYCESNTHILLYAATNRYDRYNINLCTDEIWEAGITLKLNTFTFNNNEYGLAYHNRGVFLLSKTKSVKLDISFCKRSSLKSILSNERLYIITNGVILVYSIETMERISRFIYNNAFTITKYNNVTVVDNKIYIISVVDYTLYISIYDETTSTIHKVYECTINKISTITYFDDFNDYVNRVIINSICELNGKIYISLVYKTYVNIITIANEKFYYCTEEPDSVCFTDKEYMSLSCINKCIICLESKSNCNCKINKIWESYEETKTIYTCKKHNTGIQRACDCGSCYTETVILEYNILTGIMSVLSQLPEKYLYLSTFEGKLYSYDKIHSNMFGVFDGIQWIELMNENNGAFMYGSKITNFCLMRDYNLKKIN